mgnify:CR=1 FL=1
MKRDRKRSDNQQQHPCQQRRTHITDCVPRMLYNAQQEAPPKEHNKKRAKQRAVK